MELKLPAPCVVVLIGPSSSGKTTWALEHFEASEVVSSDALRAMVGVDEDDQRASAAAFEVLEKVVDERIGRGLTTVIDTTGLHKKNRMSWMARSHDADLPIYAAVMDTPPDECERRNAERSRPLPKATLRKQITKFGDVVAGLEEEDFDGILSQQPVAAVPPQLVAAPQTDNVESTEVTHTFGLVLSRFNWSDDADARAGQIASVAQRAEQAGFRDIWVMDHFRQIHQVGRPWEDLPEAYTTLSYLAAVTSTVRLGTLVTAVTHRNPALLGKMVATLDVLSGGRANCGIGIGWDRKEHAGYGIDFPDVSQRYDLLEDTLEMLPLLWGKGSPSFEGRTLSAEELVCYPRPIQERIPILIGGSGEKRTLRLVAKYGDAANLFGSPDTVAHKVGVLHGHCDDLDRDLGTIQVTHLVNTLVASDRKELRRRVDALRSRDQSVEEYSKTHNAGTADELSEFFSRYDRAGARHSIVSIPDVSSIGSIEAFEPVITAFGSP